MYSCLQDEEAPESSCRRYIPPLWSSPKLLRKMTPKLKRKSKPQLVPAQHTLLLSMKHQSETRDTGCCYRVKDSW